MSIDELKKKNSSNASRTFTTAPSLTAPVADKTEASRFECAPPVGLWDRLPTCESGGRRSSLVDSVLINAEMKHSRSAAGDAKARMEEDDKPPVALGAMTVVL